MLKKYNKIRIFTITLIYLACVSLNFLTASNTYAEGYGVTVSPMNERIILNPGEKYEGSFNIANSNVNTETLTYIATASPFYVDENYDIYYDGKDDYSQIVNWTTIHNPQGSVPVNSVTELKYTIDVPENAPAGGQYVAIRVQSGIAQENNDGSGGSGIKLSQVIGITHIIYAEIPGTSIHSGEIMATDLSGFMFSGNIKGTATIKNTGNVHGVAKYTLQVYPLFSNEEVYTNEEDPLTATILPERSRYVELSWNGTPPVGIFNVVYTVEYEGEMVQISKLVIVCPLWLLFIVILATVALIVWLVIRIKIRKKATEE